jgi:hypothetical protein
VKSSTALTITLVPFEQGRRVVAGIPGARFVALDSANHALLSREPAWEKFAHEMEEFSADGSAILTG